MSQLCERYILRCRSRKGAASFFMTVEKTCSCFGHFDVDITDELTARTRIEIDRAVEDGEKSKARTQPTKSVLFSARKTTAKAAALVCAKRVRSIGMSDKGL